MRKKEEILNDVRRDILSEVHKENAPLWMQYRLIEVLIDMRDLLKTFTEQHKDHWELYHPPKGGEE